MSAAPKVRNQAFDSVQKWAPVFAGNKECLRACTSVLKKVGHIFNLYNATSRVSARVKRSCTSLIQEAGFLLEFKSSAHL